MAIITEERERECDYSYRRKGKGRVASGYNY